MVTNSANVQGVPFLLKSYRRGKKKEFHFLFSEGGRFYDAAQSLQTSLPKIQSIAGDASIVVNLGQVALSEVEVLTLKAILQEAFGEDRLSWMMSAPETLAVAQTHLLPLYLPLPAESLQEIPFSQPQEAGEVLIKEEDPSDKSDPGFHSSHSDKSDPGFHSSHSDKSDPGFNDPLDLSSPRPPATFHHARMIRGTLRSGQYESAEESLIILGDVNPGAEVVSGHNIIVLGALRGIAHAGKPDRADAFIFALHLEPTQLRIAHLITRAPAAQGPLAPEIARIQMGQISVCAYKASKIKPDF